MKRATLIVLDSLGAGQMPDAADFGDKGADTIGHILDRVSATQINNLRSLGYGNIEGISTKIGKAEAPLAAFGKAAEASKGKDTITGHWEIAGLITKEPFLTFHDGFPEDFIKKFQEEIGREVVGNYAASGTEIIEVLGREHMASGKPIVYTSADSVFQIAAHKDVIPLEELYEICRTARRLLVGDWQVARVIARPFVGEPGSFTRTAERRDFAVSPTGKTVLDNIKDAGQTVWAVGKIEDIFNKQGVTDAVHTESNLDGIKKTINLLQQDFGGFIFTNLVDFDTKYGHRRDPKGYSECIEEFDSWLPEIMGAMKEEDILIICADHGNDPTHTGWDHTREYVPILAFGGPFKGGTDLGTRECFGDIGATIADYLGVEFTGRGKSFL